MLFSFTESGRFEVGRPPLARATVSFRFPLVAAFATLPAMEPIQRVLASEFPDLQGGQLNQLQLTLNATSSITTTQQQVSPLPIWIFRGGPSEYQMVVSPNFVEVSVGRSYRSRAQFTDILRLAYNALTAAGPHIATCDSVTVRYINAALAERGWQEWFRPEVAGWIAGGEIHPGQRYSMSQNVLNNSWVEFPEFDAPILTNAIIRHGLVPGVGPDIVPNGQGESFIIDCELTMPSPQPFRQELVEGIFRAYNHEIARFFDYSLSDRGREHFALVRAVNA